MVMGGRAAEELALGDVTNGAVGDIQNVTSFARAMVCEWGLSNLGPISFSSQEEPVFIGRDYQQRQSYSEATAMRIDEEVERIINDGLERARQILKENREGLDRVAKELLDRESLEGYEVYQILSEVTGRDMMPESLRQKLADREEALAQREEEPTVEVEPPGDEDPGLAANSLPSPATP
jgi:cell division protease FtsH